MLLQSINLQEIGQLALICHHLVSYKQTLDEMAVLLHPPDDLGELEHVQEAHEDSFLELVHAVLLIFRSLHVFED